MEYLSFADLIQRNGPLKRTFETGNIRVSFMSMFLANTAVHTLAPEIKAAALEFTPHQCNDLRLTKCKLNPYRFKRRPVLPGHLYNTVYVLLFHTAKINKNKWVPGKFKWNQ